PPPRPALFPYTTLFRSEDGRRLPRIARRVLSPGEADACGAFTDDGSQAAVWALKEAVLKLRIGGVFSPGAKSVRVEALHPARVADRKSTRLNSSHVKIS